MQCVILAGGFGTRMLPLTANIPKAMIDVNGKPFIHHQLDWIVGCGVDRILISIGHFGNMIQDYVGPLFYGRPVSYVDEGENLLGTAGALKLAANQNKLDDMFLVTYGDSFLPINYSEPFDYCIKHNIEALMTVYKNEGMFDKSNVIMSENTFLYDKKRKLRPENEFNYIDYGLSVLNRKIIDSYVPDSQKYGLADLFYDLSLRGELSGYEVYKRFFEIGSFSGLEDFKEWIYEKRINYTR